MTGACRRGREWRALALVLFSALPVFGQAPEFPKRLEIPGVANAAQVSPVLFRGAQPTAKGFRELARRGVRTVISMRSGRGDDPLLAGVGLRSFQIPSHQWHPETKDVVAALRVIVTPEYQPVFVHCQAGKDRTGLVVAAYEILFQGRPVEEAIAERRSFGALGIYFTNERWLRRLSDASIRDRIAKMVEAAPLTKPAP